MAAPSLGPFLLHERLAQGGMGEVWAAEHASSGLRCAIKLIRPDLMTDAAARDFDREVRSQARLDHPGIVYLLDHGRVDAAAAKVLETEPDMPWVAMEYCSSSLSGILADLSWTSLRSLLLQLLDALAHAHAAGVLHRDIKISNVLISEASDLRPGVKLADFGVAHVLADDDETTRNVGTPRYMAPEQVNGEWEMLGPWTDLYALGVLSWRLLTGRNPWAKLRGHLLAIAMLEKPLGWPGTRFPVPPGFREWIERMTAKVPADRYQLASDAAAALLELPSGEVADGLWLPEDSGTGLPGAGTLIPHFLEDEIVLPRAPLVMPLDEPPPENEASICIHAAGLGLLPLRRPPFIGRSAERQLAWGLLRHVAQTGRPRALSVVGAPGLGISRFIGWVGEAAMRTGQGLRVSVRLVPGRDAGDQIIRALRAWFRVGAMDRVSAQAHLETWVEQADHLEDLAAMLVRGQASDSTWQPAVRACLVALGKRRPLVFCLEGVARHPAVLPFVTSLTSLERAAILVVSDAPIEGAEALELGPLGEAAMHRLADAMVGLDPEVRETLIRRASGSPGFLMSTLCHWAERGRLTTGVRGFVLEGDQAGAPTLSVVAVSRLTDVLRELPVEAHASLELLATLGMHADRDIWAAVDGRKRSRWRSRVVECLASRGLVVEDDSGPRFTSVPFREAVLQSAADRLPAYHRRCAETLGTLDSAVAVLARGRHLLAAGEASAALEPLKEGVERVAAREGAVAALSALAELDAAVEALFGPQRLRWRAVVDVLQAGFLIELGREEEATEPIENALRTAEVLSDSNLQARAWACQGATARRREDPGGAIRDFRKALDLAEGIPSAEQGRWWVELGKAHLAQGDRGTWSACMTAAADCAATDVARGSPQLVPLGRAAAAQVAGRFEAALACLDEAYALAAEMGSGLARLSVLRSRAHTLIDAHRLDEAREAFARALTLALQLRSPKVVTVLANSVALEFRLGRHAHAVDLFDRHRYLLPSGQGNASLVPLHCAAMAVAASRSQWNAVSHHAEHVARHGAWSWEVLACNLVTVRVTVDFARSEGKKNLVRRLGSLSRERAQEAGSNHPDWRALQTLLAAP